MRSVGLGEHATFIDGVGADLGVDAATCVPPSGRVTFEPEVLDRLDGAIESDPRHHLGVGELGPLAPHLPDALVGMLPVAFEPFHHGLLDAPRVLVRLHPAESGLVHGVHDLAEHVELDLVGRPVADPDRCGSFETAEPRKLELGKATFAGEAVHDLES